VKKSRWLWALLIAALAAGVWGGTVLATSAGGQTTTTLAKSSFDEIDINSHTIPADIWQARLKTQGMSDVYVVDNKFAPVDPATGAVRGFSGWHSHPGPSLIFVVAGTVTNYSSDDPTCTGHTYTAGQGFVDSGDDVHNLRNEGSVQAETIAVQLLPKDTPTRRIDQPAPGNCPF
jgi:quercetin dioxygenase-like cupin family protein